MIRRPKRAAQIATDNTNKFYVGNGHFEEGFPATLVNSAPSSNGYFENGSSSTRSNRYRRRRKFQSKQIANVTRILILVVGGFLCSLLISFMKLSTYSRSAHTVQTPTSFLPIKNFTIVLPPDHFQPPARKITAPMVSLSTYDNNHDYGNLKLRFPEYREFQNSERVIYHDQREDAGYVALWNAADDDGYMESYYAFDDDDKRSPLVMYDDADIHLRKQCRRTSWHRELPLSCNAIHDFDFQSHIRQGDAEYLGHGYYRTVFLANTTHDEPFVVKMLNWNHNFTYDDFEYVRMDAVVNDKLNGNPEIVNSYGFCGNTIMGEAMVLGDLQKIAIPSYAGDKIENIDSATNMTVQNSLSGTQKLEWSLQMAEAVLLLHSYPGGVIVHDDIQLPQFLLSDSGRLRLNDFNRAEIMLWNEKDQEYCKYRNYPGWGNWRAPEEYHDKPLDEKIDIWSLGNNMYSLLTGVYPFYELTEEETQENVKNGMTEYIDPRYNERSFAESKLAEIIPLCWVYDPRQRIDIFELVDLLHKAVHDNGNNR